MNPLNAHISRPIEARNFNSFMSVCGQAGNRVLGGGTIRLIVDANFGCVLFEAQAMHLTATRSRDVMIQ